MANMVSSAGHRLESSLPSLEQLAGFASFMVWMVHTMPVAQVVKPAPTADVIGWTLFMLKNGNIHLRTMEQRFTVSGTDVDFG